MDASSEFSDLEETQASQMLADLLVPGSLPIKSPDPSSRHHKPPFQGDLTESFTSSRNSNSLPAYNLHGLAATQTQTSVGGGDMDVDEALEGSQKENIQELTGVREGRTTPGPFRPVQSRESPSKATVHTPKVDKGTGFLAHSRMLTPNTKPLPISSLQPPMAKEQAVPSGSKASSGARNTRTSRAALPPSPDVTEDSFAAFDPDFDTEDHRRAANRHLDIPLSELIESQGEPEPLSRFRQDYKAGVNAKSKGPMLPPSMGRVLVESTPTNSVTSQSDPSLEDSRLEGFHDIIETQIVESNQGISQESDDYGKSLLRPNFESSLEESQGGFEPTQPATQPDTQPATQPASQAPTQPQGTTGPYTASAPSYAQTGTANFGQSIPQSHQTGNSLLRGMPLEKQHRYAKYVQAPPPVQASIAGLPWARQFRPQQSPPVAAVQGAQPSGDGDTILPARHQLPPSRPASFVPNPSTPVCVPSSEALEIIPDSEAQHSSPYNPTRDFKTVTDDESRDENAEPEEANAEGDSAEGRDHKTEGEENADHEDDEEGQVVRLPQLKGKGKAKQTAQRERIISPTESESESERPPAKRRAVAVEVQEDEVESSQEVPLSATTRAQKVVPAKFGGKGKGKEKAKPVPAKAKATKVAVKPALRATTKAVSRRRKAAGNRSWEHAVIPSSVPEQDFPRAAKPKGRFQQPETPLASTSAKFLTPEPESDEDDGEEEEDGVQESAGGFADDMDIIGDVPPKGIKRKRANHALKREAEPGTPPARKVLRSCLASAKKNNDATRVMALWPGDKSYYSGTVESKIGEALYGIKFDDGDTISVKFSDLRPLALQVHDHVTYGKSIWEVVKVNRISRGFITIQETTKGRSDAFEVNLRDVKISANTIESDWKERRFPNTDTIVPQVQFTVPKAALRETTTPTKATKQASSNSPPGKPLSGIAFLLTWTDSPKTRQKMSEAVEKLGGKISQYDDLFSNTGMVSKTRWRIEKEQTKWKGDGTVQRLFLLAREHSSTGKYLVALAMGIPCVSLQWLTDSIPEVSEVVSGQAGRSALSQSQFDLEGWRRYLLPRGVSRHLNRTLSQQVDWNWGEDPCQLTNLPSNPVAPKVLANTTILFVGHGVFPDKSHTKLVPHLAIAMGAEAVEAVKHPNHKMHEFEKYTYIITRHKNEGYEIPEDKRRDWAWLLDCLMTSALLETPKEATDEQSQNV